MVRANTTHITELESLRSRLAVCGFRIESLGAGRGHRLFYKNTILLDKAADGGPLSLTDIDRETRQLRAACLPHARAS
jgi:hypothetical protein